MEADESEMKVDESEMAGKTRQDKTRESGGEGGMAMSLRVWNLLRAC
jgi:hypothetical protein